MLSGGGGAKGAAPIEVAAISLANVFLPTTPISVPRRQYPIPPTPVPHCGRLPVRLSNMADFGLVGLAATGDLISPNRSSSLAKDIVGFTQPFRGSSFISLGLLGVMFFFFKYCVTWTERAAKAS